MVQVDLRQPDPAELLPGAYQSLEKALSEGRMGQACRDTARLLQLGAGPEDIALFVACFDAARGEFGIGHAPAVAVDALAYLEHRQGLEAVLPLVQAMEQSSDTQRRRPLRPRPEPRDPGDDAEEAGRRFRELVEAEDGEAAEALLRGALARDWGREIVEPWFFAPLADHFLSFGHPLIYQIKIFDLLERVQFREADTLLGGLLTTMLSSTRHDNLPNWRAFRREMDALAPRIGELYGALGARAEASQTWDRSALLNALLDGRVADLFRAVEAACTQGASLNQMSQTLVLAASERLLRFELSIHDDATIQDGWLDATHTLTTASALRHAVQRYNEPEILRILLLVGGFIQRVGALDQEESQRVPAEPAKENSI